MIIQNQLNNDSMRVVAHGMSLAREPPVIFGSVEVICGGLVVNFSVSQNHEKHCFSCVKIHFELIWNDLGRTRRKHYREHGRNGRHIDILTFYIIL